MDIYIVIGKKLMYKNIKKINIAKGLEFCNKSFYWVNNGR